MTLSRADSYNSGPVEVNISAVFHRSFRHAAPRPATPPALRLRARLLHPATLACALAALALAATACKRRPDFDADVAQRQLAEAFGRELDQVQIYDQGRGSAPEEWIVDFKIDGFLPLLQARFGDKDHAWALRDVRERPSGSADTPWVELGVLIGRTKKEAAEKAESTMATIRQLAELVERYATSHGSRYPTVDMDGLEKLVLGEGLTPKWAFDTDAWGSAIAYHAAPDGQSYIILSPGADGQYEQSLEKYFDNTDAATGAVEAYAGRTSDPNRDIIFATGAFVQSYEPAG